MPEFPMDANQQAATRPAGGPPFRHHGSRVLGVLAVAGLMAAGVALIPDGVLTSLGAKLSPDGEISATLIPVLRRLCMLMGMVAGALVAGLVLEWRSVVIGVAVVGVRLYREWGWMTGAWRFHWRRLSWTERVTIVVLLAIGTGIRLWYLEQPMRFDEATTVTMYASSPWYLGLANYSSPNNHLLNTLLVRMCILLADNREWVVRLPALTAGLACLPLIYFYARLMYSRSAALVALAWLAVSLPFIDMSTNARGYTMVAGAGLVSHISIFYIFRRNYFWAALLNALAIGLGLLAVPVAILFVGSGVLWALLEARRQYKDKRLRRFTVFAYGGSVCAGGGIALAGYVPMLLVLGPQWLFANQWVTPRNFVVFLHRMPVRIGAFLHYNVQTFPVPVVVVLGLAAAGYLLHWRRIEKTGISLPFVLAAVCGMVLMLTRRYPLWGLSPMWMLLAAVLVAAVSAGFTHLAAKVCGSRGMQAISVVAALGLAGTGAWNLIRANPEQTMDSAGGYILNDIRPVARYLAEHAAPGDEILTTSALVVYQYYALRYGADHLNWSWDGNGRRRVYVLKTPFPDLCYEQAMWQHLNELRIMSTNDLTSVGEIHGHSLWWAEVEP